MSWLVLESTFLLLKFDVVLHTRPFRSLHRIVRQCEVRPEIGPHSATAVELCHAMDLACVFYLKRVLCLQRSAATVSLLRRHGWEAEMVIGAKTLPFESHAWAEIRGAVVNDKPYITEIYQVLERC